MLQCVVHDGMRAPVPRGAEPAGPGVGTGTSAPSSAHGVNQLAGAHLYSLQTRDGEGPWVRAAALKSKAGN